MKLQPEISLRKQRCR